MVNKEGHHRHCRHLDKNMRRWQHGNKVSVIKTPSDGVDEFVTTHMLIICSYIMEQVCCLFLSIENSVTLSPSDVHSAWPSPRVPEMLEKTYEQILWEIPTGEANRAMPIDPPR